MNTSIFLAQAFGLYFIIIGLAMLYKKEYYQKAAVEMAKSGGVMLITSIVTLILGIILVLFHNVWVADWRAVITVLCWMTLLKGMLRLAFPESMSKWVAIFLNDRAYDIMLSVFVIFGGYLAYVGFFLS